MPTQAKRSKFIAFYPQGQEPYKSLKSRQVETPNGRATITKRSLRESVDAIPMADDDVLEAVIMVNLQRDDEKYPLQTLFFYEKTEAPIVQGRRVSAPRAAAVDNGDDDIPF